MIYPWPAELKNKLSPIGESQPTQKQQSAVCLILRTPAPDFRPEILFIRRAERADDPWSGHMAFPGGRRHREDQTIAHTAVRETLEEIGMSLRSEESLGALGPYSPRVSPELAVYPFIYLTEHSGELVLNVTEVDEIHWVPLAHAFKSSSFTQRPYTFRGMTLTLPSFSFDDHHIWGVTYVILLDFLYKFVETSLGKTLCQEAKFDPKSTWNYTPYR